MVFYAETPFSSVQGEGIWAGCRQIFVRFRGCNLRCTYCDERTVRRRWRRFSPGSMLRTIRTIDRPRGFHHSVAFTGGEPLLYGDVLRALLPSLKRSGFRVYLETNGTLPDELAGVIRYVDIVAMDVKLPSSTGGRGFWREHRRFIRIAKRKGLFVKLVVTAGTAPADFRDAVRMVKGAGRSIPVCIQPVTPVTKKERMPGGNTLLRLQEEALRELADVRVIPQMHKMLGVK